MDPVALTPSDDTLASLAAGIADRLRLLVIAIDRLDRLETGSGEWLNRFPAEELPAAARELTLRTLRTATEPGHFALLQALAAAETQSLGQLMATLGWGRLTLTEYLNDLIQVGLVGRNIDTDHAQITSAGLALVRWLQALVVAVSQNYGQKMTKNANVRQNYP
jgi:DNA-binding HxlR family transcriptional regulator